MKALHAEFHKSAARVVELALAGKKAEAHDLMAPVGGEYTKISSKLNKGQGVHVAHPHRVRGAVEQDAIALLTFAELNLSGPPPGNIADIDDRLIEEEHDDSDLEQAPVRPERLDIKAGNGFASDQ